MHFQWFALTLLHIWYTNSASSRFFITMQWFNRFVTGKDGWGCETIQWDYSTWNPEGGRLWYVGWRVQLSRHTEVLGLVYFARLLSSEYQKDFLLYNSSFVIYAAFQALRWVLMCHTYWLCEDDCLAFKRLTCCWIFMLLEFCNAMFICCCFFFQRGYGNLISGVLWLLQICVLLKETPTGSNNAGLFSCVVPKVHINITIKELK